MRIYSLVMLSLLLCSCARKDFVRAPEPFRPLQADATLEQRQAYFDKQKVHAVGANHGEVGGLPYDSTELLRYYDDSRNGDASEIEKRAQEKVSRAEEWAFFGSAYGSIVGIVWGGLNAYLQTANSDFAALNSAVNGGLVGWGWGALAGTAVGWVGFAWERHLGEDMQRQAAGEFNRSARVLLKLQVAPQRIGVEWEY